MLLTVIGGASPVAAAAAATAFKHLYAITLAAQTNTICHFLSTHPHRAKQRAVKAEVLLERERK